MPLHTSQAIVLRHLDYGEADRIVTLFTLDHGLLRGFARGARKSRKRFGAALEPFAEVRLFWNDPRGSGLPGLQEAELDNLHLGLRRDLATLGLASYGCELVAELFGEGQPHPDAYHMLRAFLAHLDGGGAGPDSRLLLELRVLSLAGYIPHFLHCAECGGSLPETLRFNAERGGSLCAACAGDGTGVDVSLPTLGSLARSLRTPSDLFAGFRFGARTLEEGRRVLGAALAQHLSRPLRSRTFLDRTGW
jgi:DNA repair protein RecO (recombination protein O)